MTVPWETVRIFISSTFDDMHAERDYLVKQVFPELREWCEKRRLRLVDIDLRWGVKEEDTQNKNVVEVCLRRIDEARPFFLCFLGQRRGWVPRRGDISPSTLAEDAYPDLEGSVGRRSVTEMEILHALGDPFHRSRKGREQPAEYYQPVKYALFYLRDRSYLEQLPQDFMPLRTVYTNAGIENGEERKEADEELRRWVEVEIPALCEKHGRPQRRYTAHWDPAAASPELLLPLACPSLVPVNVRQWQRKWADAGIHLTGTSVDGPNLAKAEAYNRRRSSGRLSGFECQERSLSRVLIEDLQVAIAARYADHAEIAEATDLQQELDQQEQFLFAAGEGFVERGRDFDALDAYVAGDSRQLFVLNAPAGMGKSSLLARWVDHYRTHNEGRAGQSIHFRFIGQSDRSTTVPSLLHLLLSDIKETTNRFTDEIPDDPQKLRQELPKLLEAVGRTGKTVIVLDALNQLETGLSDLGWLPYRLPWNVKLIVSFKRGEQKAEDLLKRMQGQVILSEVRPFDTLDDRRRLVSTYLGQYLKQLDDQLLEALIDQSAAANPLYLKVVLSELRVFGAFPNLGEKIRSDFGETPVSAFQAVLDRLESDPAYSAIDPRQAVPLLFGLLAHARQGLSAEELSELLVESLSFAGQAVSLPAATDSVHLYLRQVRPFLARRADRYDFFFESFKIAAQERYAGEQGSRKSAEEWHRLLAKYFGGLPTWRPDDDETPSLHKIAELPYHQTLGKLWVELSDALTDFNFLEAKCRFLSVYELETDYRFALQNWQGDLSQKTVLAAFEECLRLESHHVQRHPGLLFPLFYNHLTRLHRPDDPVHVLCEEASSLHHDWLRIRQISPVKPSISCSIGVQRLRAVLDLALTPDGRQAVTATEGARLGVWDLASECLLRTLEGHGDEVSAVTVTPDGKRVVSGSWDATLKVWDLARGCLLRTLEGHKRDVTAVAVTPDGRHVISGSADTTIKVWDLASGRLLRSLETHGAEVNAVAITPDGQYIVSGAAGGRPSWRAFTGPDWDRSEESIVRVWHLASGEVLRTLRGHRGSVNSVTITPDGTQIVSGSDDQTLRVWDLASGKLVATLRCDCTKRVPAVGDSNTQHVRSVVITPDGKQIVSGLDDQTIQVWDLASGQVLRTLEGHKSRVRAVRVTPDGQRIVSGSQDESLREWELASGRLLSTLKGDGHTDDVEAVAVTPDGKRIVSGSQDKTLKVWDLDSRRLLHTLEGHTKDVHAVAVTPDGRTAVSGSSDETLKVWDLDSGCVIRTLEGHEGSVHAVAVTPDGKRAVSGSSDETLKVWDLDSGCLLRTLEGHEDWVVAVAVAPDGQHVISGSRDATLRVWDPASGELLHTLQGHKGPVTCVAVSPDGRKIVSGSRDDTLKVWNLMTGKLLRSVKGHSDDVISVAVSPDGQQIVSGSRDHTLKVWDITSGQLLTTLEGRGGWVQAVAVAPDGKKIISGSEDGSVVLWDTAGSVSLLDGHADVVSALALTPDDKTLVSGSSDHTIGVWDLASGRLLRSLDGHTQPVCTVVLTPDGKQILSGGKDATLAVWNLENGQLVYSRKERRGAVDSLAVTADGKVVLSGSSDEYSIPDVSATERIAIKVRDLSDGKLHHAIRGHNGVVYALAVTPDGQKVISSGFDHCLKVWDLASGELLGTHEFDATQTTVISDGKQIVSGSYSGMLYVLDMDCRMLRVLEGHTVRVTAVALTPDGQQILSCSEDGTLRKWDLVSGESRTWMVEDVTTKSLCLSHDLHWIILGKTSGAIRIFEWVH